MIDGVEILSSSPIKNDIDPRFLFIGIVLGLALALVFFIFQAMGEEIGGQECAVRVIIFRIIALVSLIGAIACLILYLNIADQKSGYIYKVIISDDVGFKEFYNKYIIIDQKGKVFTVEERR
jgi:hypothetical protein